jgi:hypothetical protein
VDRPAPTGAKELSLVRALPPATLLAAVAFSLSLATSIREEVFFSGDGGMKFALTRQLARGDLRLDLRLPAEPWVADLWRQGLYPFDRPFSYEIAGRRWAQYPVFFSLATAPFLAAFGYAGLYVVPMLALWATWIAFLLLCRRAGAGPVATSLALAAVAFASPLTLYGAMYWEHTPAVALAFLGIVLLLSPGAPTGGGARAFAAGVLVGLSAWFRSEHLVLAAVLALLAAASSRLGLGLRRPGSAIAGLALPLAALASVNLAIYGHPLGTHGLVVIQPVGLPARAANALETLGSLLRLLAEYFPLAVPALAVGVLAIARPLAGEPGRGARLLAWTSALYVLLLPAILPPPELAGGGGKQWGPRFLLMTVPMLCAAAAFLAGRVAELPSRAWRAVAVSAFLGAFALGAWQNAWVGSRTLRLDYAERMLPLQRFLRADEAWVVAASDQFAAQEMTALVDQKRFFFVKGPEDLERLGAAALRHGEGRFLFLSDQRVEGAGPFQIGGSDYVLSVSPIGRQGYRYLVHEVRVRQVGRDPARATGDAQ